MKTQSTRQSPTSILIAMTFCMALQMTGFVMILPLFARRFETYGAGVEALGMSALAYALTSTCASPFMGLFADRIGRRPVILLSLAAYALIFSGYLFAASAWLFILLRGIAGALTAGLTPSITSIIGDLSAEDRRAQWIGIVNGGASVGWIVGPLFGGMLYDRFGYGVPFLISIAMELLALLLAVFLIRDTNKPEIHPNKLQPFWKGGFSFLSPKSAFILLMFISFGVMFAWAFIEPRFMFYAYDDLGWTSTRLGLIMSAYGMACMFGEFTLGHLSDRLGRKPVLVLGLVLFSAQFIGLVIFRDATWIVISFILAGLGNAIFDPALSAHFLDITPPENTAGILGLKSTAGSLGNMLGPGLVVAIARFVSPQVVFLIASVLVLVLTIVTLFALRIRPGLAAVPDFTSAAVSR